MPTKGQSFTAHVLIWNTADNEPRANDAANLTLKLVRDGQAAVGAGNSPADVDNGIVSLVVTAGEAGSYNLITVEGVSSTGDTVVIPISYAMVDAPALAAHWTEARAGYQDNLNIGENVAGTSEVTAIQNNTRCVRVVPAILERPDTGSTVFMLHLYLYDTEGKMEAPDAAPTIHAYGPADASRDSNLDSTTMTLVGTGHYKSTYTAASDHAIEQVRFEFSVVEGGETLKFGNTAQVVDTTAVDFTAADRTKLEAINGKLPSGTISDFDETTDSVTITTAAQTSLVAAIWAYTGAPAVTLLSNLATYFWETFTNRTLTRAAAADEIAAAGTTVTHAVANSPYSQTAKLITVDQHSASTVTFTIYLDGSVRDVSSYTFALTAYGDKNTLLFSKSHSDFVVTGAASGVIRVPWSAADLATACRAGRVELKMSKTGESERPLKRRLTIKSSDQS